MTFIKKYSEFVILFLFAIFGVLTAGSYGFAWDEFAQREIGEVCWNYIVHDNQYFLEYAARDHGAIFEMFLLAIEKISGVVNSKDIYTQRHLICNLFFLLSAYYFFRLILLLYNNKIIAIIGLFFLILQPTIYGHSFFNSKDVPFLSVLIICFYQFALCLRDKKNYQFLLLALFTSVLINIRIMGILFLGFAAFFILFDLFVFRKEKQLVKKHSIIFFLYGCSSIAFTIIEWPLFWHHPIDNFIYVFNNLSKYPWTGANLIAGQVIPAANPGWAYIPTWFFVNTPIVYLLFGIVGIILVSISVIKLLRKNDLKNIDRNNLLYVLCFFSPIIIVIVLKSVLYDTWRHLFYIYPSFILLAVYCINYYSQTKYKKTIYTVSAVGITGILIFIGINFPFHHVFFNPFVSLHKDEYIRKNYDMDFWAVNYNRSLDYILKNDTGNQISVYSDYGLARANSLMLNESEKKRFVFTDTLDRADYFITNYRWHPQDYTAGNLQEIKSFMVLGSKVNTIFKVKR